jgi:hypothetical protein
MLTGTVLSFEVQSVWQVLGIGIICDRVSRQTLLATAPECIGKSITGQWPECQLP